MTVMQLSTRARTVLAAVRRQGSASRSALIRDCGLSGTAIFRATEELEAAGLVRAGESVASGRGQPSAMIHIVADAAFSLGLSVMTDRADAILIDLAGQVRGRQDVTLPGMPRAAMVDAATRFAADALADINADKRRLLGLGVAVAGYFTGVGSVNPGAELDDWALIDLPTQLSRQCAMPVGIENIATAAALGERLLGVGARYDSFCYVNVAAGFGAGLIIDGQPMRGKHGNAGEIAGLFSLFGKPTPNLAQLRGCLADHGIKTASVSDMVARFDVAWPGVDAWLHANQPAYDMLFAALRYMLDADALILGGRLPRPLARKIVDAVIWPESAKPARRGQRAPATMLDVATLEPELSGPLGAAALMFHDTMFS